MIFLESSQVETTASQTELVYRVMTNFGVNGSIGAVIIWPMNKIWSAAGEKIDAMVRAQERTADSMQQLKETMIEQGATFSRKSQ